MRKDTVFYDLLVPAHVEPCHETVEMDPVISFDIRYTGRVMINERRRRESLQRNLCSNAVMVYSHKTIKYNNGCSESSFVLLSVQDNKTSD